MLRSLLIFPLICLMLFASVISASAEKKRRDPPSVRDPSVRVKQKEKQKETPKKQKHRRKSKATDLQKRTQKSQPRSTSETPSPESMESVEVFVDLSDTSTAAVEMTVTPTETTTVTTSIEGSPEHSAVSISGGIKIPLENGELQQFSEKIVDILLFLPRKTWGGIVFAADRIKQVF